VRPTGKTLKPRFLTGTTWFEFDTEMRKNKGKRKKSSGSYYCTRTVSHNPRTCVILWWNRFWKMISYIRSYLSSAYSKYIYIIRPCDEPDPRPDKILLLSVCRELHSPCLLVYGHRVFSRSEANDKNAHQLHLTLR